MSDFLPCDWCGWMPKGCTCPSTDLDARRLTATVELRHAQAVERARPIDQPAPQSGEWLTTDGMLAAHLFDEWGRSICGMVTQLLGRRLRDGHGVRRCARCVEVSGRPRTAVA